MTAVTCCAPHGNITTITRPISAGSDRVIISNDAQAAQQALDADRQAVLPSTARAATSRSADEIVSSLKIAAAAIEPSRNATTQKVEGNISGTVTFTQVGSMLILVADLGGLQPGTSHALEIHESNDLSAGDLSSAGAVWSGMFNQGQTPLGELGNIDADATGKAYFERTLAGASVGGANSVVGRSIVVRALPMDAGKSAIDLNACIAGGVIERREQ